MFLISTIYLQRVILFYSDAETDSNGKSLSFYY